MQDLIITLIQTELHWENIEANLAMLEEKIWQINQTTDLIILPEMFSTGFTMNIALAEPHNSKTFRWMKQMATQTDAVIMGSFILREKEHCYNRLIWMEPGGKFSYYDKRHLFRMAGEHEIYESGKTKTVMHLKGWRVLPLVCYDLRFPVWSRRTTENSYDCLIYIANWPEKRRNAWNTLLRARAIENISYCVGVNRVGPDGNGHQYSGDSSVIQPDGDIFYTEKDDEKISTIVLNAKLLQDFRNSFPADLDADNFEILL